MTVMESAREAEEVYTDFYEIFYNVVRKPKFRAMGESHPDLTPFTLTDLHDFLDKWKVDFLPLVRRIRMSCILEIYRRAASLGIAGTGLGADFPQLFLAASLEEADAWQETAHLLADPGNASFLLRSMGSVASDNTEELFGLAEGP